jgi:hypothetical protein
VLQIRGDLLVCALGVAGHAFQVLLGLRVVVNLEMIGGVRIPPEVVVPDLVLAVVRDEGRLCVGRCRGGQQQASRHRANETPRQAAPRARAHRGLLAGCHRNRIRPGNSHLTVSRSKPQSNRGGRTLRRTGVPHARNVPRRLAKKPAWRRP